LSVSSRSDRKVRGSHMSDHLWPLLLPFQPAASARSIRHTPLWLLSFCLLAGAAALTDIIAHPHDVSATLAHLPPSATTEEREIVRTELDATLPLRIALLPSELLATWSARALLLYILIHAFGSGDPPRGKHLMCVAVGAGVVDVAERILETAFAAALLPTPDQAVAVPWTLLALTGDVSNYALRLLLTSINMFTLWYVWAVGWALSVLCGIHKSKAVLIAGSVWAVSAGCTIVVLHLLRNAYAFSP
jgi:hypothetical protein